MAKYRKKPVVIEAWQYTDPDAPWPQWMRAADVAQCFEDGEPPSLEIPTLEGDMRANLGDWIIQGIKGEVYPCKPDIFAATYEPVET